MSDEPTCGKGLAEHSAVPSKMAQYLDALADNLALHQRSVDLPEPAARKELAAYMSLTNGFRDIAARLGAAGREMAGYRDLPMAQHDEQALNDPRLMEAFVTFTRVQDELLELLNDATERDKAMLGAMKP